MLRRPLRQPGRGPMAGNIPPALQRANRLMAAGQYDEAAGIFERFATGAVARNGPRAPWFLLQAGHARILAGQVPDGMIHVQKGLVLLASRGRVQQFYRATMRFVTELKARGLTDEAKQIEDYLNVTLPAGFIPGPVPIAGSGKPRVLPTNCPGCGGPIRSGEVEWTDEITAECPYCGNAIRSE